MKRSEFKAELQDGVLTFQLGAKHTDCLAKDLCLPGTKAGDSNTGCC